MPWIEKPGGLQSMGLQRVRHDWATEHKYISLLDSIIHDIWIFSIQFLAITNKAGLNRLVSMFR